MPLNHEQSMAGVRMIFDGGGRLDRKIDRHPRPLTRSSSLSTLHIPAQDAIASVLAVTRTDDAGLTGTDDPLRRRRRRRRDGRARPAVPRRRGRGARRRFRARHVARRRARSSRHGSRRRVARPEFVVRDHRLVGAPRQSAPEWLASLEDALRPLDRRRPRARRAHPSAVRARQRVLARVRGRARWCAIRRPYVDGLTRARRPPREPRRLRRTRRGGGMRGARRASGHRARSRSASRTPPGAPYFGSSRRRTTARGRRSSMPWRPASSSTNNRSGTQIDARGDAALDMYRVLYSLDDWSIERSLLATRGDRLALVEERTWFVDGAAGESEVLSLGVVECDANGLVVAITTFDIDDLDRAYDALDARYVELGGPDLRPYRHAFDARDWDRYASFFEEDACDRRPAPRRRRAGRSRPPRRGPARDPRARARRHAPDRPCRGRELRTRRSSSIGSSAPATADPSRCRPSRSRRPARPAASRR